MLLEPARMLELLVAEVAHVAAGGHRRRCLEHHQLEVVLLVRVESAVFFCCGWSGCVRLVRLVVLIQRVIFDAGLFCGEEAVEDLITVIDNWHFHVLNV